LMTAAFHFEKSVVLTGWCNTNSMTQKRHCTDPRISQARFASTVPSNRSD
jgi:hypothetical protein